MAKFLIVDAHSVIFAWPEMRALHARRMVLARDALVKRLTEYQDFTGVRVVAVFDGQGGQGGKKGTEASEPGGIQIFYSGRGQTADDIVERLVAKYGRQHDITVATSDLLEQETAAGFGGTCVSVELLRQMLEETETGFRREYDRRARER